MKIAVVGSGPAAVSIISAIYGKKPDVEITVFDVGPEPMPPLLPPPTENPNERSFLVRLYKYLRKYQGFSFPPPKSQFGYIPKKVKVSGNPRVWASEMEGGLSQIWGASVFPMTDNELKNWPLTAGDLAPYYQAVTDMIGISGADDGLSDYFGSASINRPATVMLNLCTRLSAAIHGKTLETGVQFISGVARLALETRPDHETTCIFCGGCMSGCSRGSVYCSSKDFKRLKALGAIKNQIFGKVLSFDQALKSLQIRTDEGTRTTEKFDRIYLGAGCLGSSEIVMRSFNLLEGPVMRDTALFTFPLIDMGKWSMRDAPAGSQVLTNLVVGHVSQRFNGQMMQIQFYPSFEHLWRYYLPCWIWPIADWFGQVFKKRLLWGRLYLTEEKAARYGLRLNQKDEIELDLLDEGGGKYDARQVLNDLRVALKGTGFMLPKIGPVRHATSSHYSSTFPYHGSMLDVPTSGEIAPGVYLCDSSVFSDAPSISPTLTIMANAWRMAEQSLSE